MCRKEHKIHAGSTRLSPSLALQSRAWLVAPSLAHKGMTVWTVEEEEELKKALFFLPPLPSVRGRIYIWNLGNSGLHFVTYLYTRMGCHCCLVSPSFPDRVKINAEEKPNLHYIHFKLSANDQG